MVVISDTSCGELKKTLKLLSIKLYNDVINEALFKKINDITSTQIEYIKNKSTAIGTSVEELTQTTKSMAENSYDIKKGMEEFVTRSKELKTTISERKREVLKAVDDMNSIVQGLEELIKFSDQINKTIKQIYSITEQTTILALNASIEAARAGDVGRGFAVVAEEVRKLAQKTEEFATNINSIVITLQKKMHKFSKDVGKLKEVINSTVNAFEHVESFYMENLKASEQIDDSISSIVTSLEEQSSVVAGIGENIQGLVKDIEKIKILLEAVLGVQKNTSECIGCYEG